MGWKLRSFSTLWDTTQNDEVDVVELLDALLMITNIRKPGTMATLVAMRDLSDRLNMGVRKKSDQF